MAKTFTFCRFFCFTPLIVSVASCSSQKVESVSVKPITPLVVTVPAPLPVPAPQVPVEVETKSPMKNLAKTRNSYVDRWIQFYTKNDTARFQRHLDRATPYEHVVKTILKSNGLPPEIFYLGIVESGYRTDAKSTAQAVGVWQFIRGTGKRYGLKMNSYVDERRDPYRSTEAAALYLKDLYNVFNSWELALAAYNAGEGRILRAVMAGKSRNFWDLANGGFLPDETLNYVPKFIAAATLGENPSHYGFVKNSNSQLQPDLEIVEVPHSTRLSTLAREAQIPVEVLTENNPQLLRGITPPFESTYHLWVPKKHAESVHLAATRIPKSLLTHPGAQLARQNVIYKKLSSQRAGRKKVTKTDTQAQYRVKKGDSLEKISQKFNVSVEKILKENAKRSSKIYAGELIRLPE
jgi:membrane-bound lytic murein transglycosylase D